MTVYRTQVAANQTWQWVLVGVAFAFFLTLPVWFKEIYYLHALVNFFLHSMVALGLRMLWRTGLVSFGTAGFMAIGGYMAGLLSKDMGVSF